MADWSAVKVHLEKMHTASKDNGVPLIGPLKILALYLSGVHYQGTGDFDRALGAFKDPIFDLSQLAGSNSTSTTQFHCDLSLLAALNALLILQQEERRDVAANSELISKIESTCAQHPRKEMHAAFKLILATTEVSPALTTTEIKQYLGHALTAAQNSANFQLISITLNLMCNNFFTDIAGEQAEKSALAAAHQAQKSGNNLWRSVAGGMLAKSYDMNGKKATAVKVFEDALRLADIAMPDM